MMVAMDVMQDKGVEQLMDLVVEQTKEEVTGAKMILPTETATKMTIYSELLLLREMSIYLVYQARIEWLYLEIIHQYWTWK